MYRNQSPAQSALQRDIARRASRQGGTTLVEVLVSMVLLSLGLIGSTQLITSAIREQSALKYKVTASRIAQELMERMRVNGAVLESGFFLDADNTGALSATPLSYSAAAVYVRNIGVLTGPCKPVCVTPQDVSTSALINTRRALNTQLRGANAAISLRPVTTGGTTSVPNARWVVIAWEEPILNTDTSTVTGQAMLTASASGCPDKFNDSALNVRCVQFRFQL